MRHAVAIVLFAAIALAAGSAPPAVAADLLSASDKRIYKSAFAAAARKKWRHARALARKGSDPLPRKILRWHDMSRPGTGASFRRITAFMRANPDWPGMDVLLQRAEETMPASMRPEKILKWFGDRRPLTADGWIMMSRALLASGRHRDAKRSARTTWLDFNFGPKQQKVFLKGFARLLNTDDHSARFDRLLWDGQYTQARRMWSMVSRDERLLATARMRLRKSGSNVDAALAQVPPRLRDHPGLLYERLKWRRRRGRLSDIVEILEDAPADLGRPEHWWVEREFAVRLLLAGGSFARAYRIARNHKLAAGPKYAEAEWLSGWIALRFLKKRRTARRHFDRAFAAVGDPAQRARAAYWAGRAMAARGRDDDAADWFAKAAIHDATFYGQLSAGRQNRGTPAALSGEPPPDGAKIAAFNRHELVRAVFMLHQLGRRRIVQPFIDRLARLSDDPARQVLAGRLALAIGRPDLGIRVARHAHRTGNPFVVLGYPVIDTPGTGLEKGLLLSVALQESDFKLRARSRVGARGLMQIMPRTAYSISRSLGLKYSRSRLTNDYKYNLIIGRAYLKSLLKRYRGSYVLTIAAYNAGPKAVKRWLDRFGDPRSEEIDAVDWIEMIPFDETRDYVQRVLASLQVYRRRLGGTRYVQSLENDLENILSR